MPSAEREVQRPDRTQRKPDAQAGLRRETTDRNGPARTDGRAEGRVLKIVRDQQRIQAEKSVS